MLFFGHRFISSQVFYHVADIDSINNTPPSSNLYIEFDEDNLDIISHAEINNTPFALKVNNITQALYASALNAKYIIVPKELAKIVQDIANNYLFDAKILVSIEEESEIEEMALLGIDGVIFSSAIIKINS